MITRFRSLLTGAALAVLALTATVLAAPASADPDAGVAPLHCSSHPHSNRDTIANRQYFNGTNVNIRRFPHTSCTSDGQGQLSHTVDYHCRAQGDPVTRNGVTYLTWTYLRDVTTNVSGWVSDAFLDPNPNDPAFTGSIVNC